jgi:DNA-binding protein YbaB
MFDKFKQIGELGKLRSQAKELERQLALVKETLEKNGVKVVVTGAQKIEYLEIDGVERKDIADVINSAFKEVQKKSAKKMMEMGGGLTGLLSGLGK